MVLVILILLKDSTLLIDCETLLNLKMEEFVINESYIVKLIILRVTGFELEIVNNCDYEDILKAVRTTFSIFMFFMDSITI